MTSSEIVAILVLVAINLTLVAYAFWVDPPPSLLRAFDVEEDTSDDTETQIGRPL